MAKEYSYDEVKNHNHNKSSWIAVHNKVYDVTAFLNEVCTDFRIFSFNQKTLLSSRLNK